MMSGMNETVLRRMKELEEQLARERQEKNEMRQEMKRIEKERDSLILESKGPTRELMTEEIDKVIASFRSDERYSSFISTIALELPFVGRDETTKAILGHLSHRINSNLTDRLQNTVPYIACCGGLGKTRYLYEQQKVLLKYCKNTSSKELEKVQRFLEDAITVNMTFHNGNNLTDQERFALQSIEKAKSQNRLITSFAARILAFHFLPGVCISHVIDKFLELNAPLSVSMAVNYILEKTNKRDIIIGVDEYTSLLRYAGAREYLKLIVDQCGSLLCKRDIFAHVLFAGTSSVQFANVFTSSFYVSHKIPMNLLTYEETKQVIDKAMKLPYFQNFQSIVQRVGSHILSAILGGHPRSIEYMFNCFLSCGPHLNFDSPSKQLMESVISKTILEINQKYPLGVVTDPTMILSYWALRSPLRKTEPLEVGLPERKTLDYLENEGFVILSSAGNDHYIIDLPVAWLYDYCSRLNRNILYFAPLRNLLDILMGPIDWQDLERFGLYYYTLRINSAIMLGKSEMFMTELLGNVTSLSDYPNILNEVKIELPKVPIQISDKLASRYPETHMAYPLKPITALNADGAAVDVVFLFPPPSPLNMFIQAKLTKSFKKGITNTLIKEEVEKTMNAIEKGERKEANYASIPKFYLILTNLDWPSVVDKIPVQRNCYCFKVSRSDFATLYGRAIAGRLSIVEMQEPN